MEFGNAVAEALEVLRNEKKHYKDYLPEKAILTGRRMAGATEGLWEDVLETIAKLVKDEIPYQYPHVAVWWYSVLIGMVKNSLLFTEFLRYVRENRKAFSGNTQYFLFEQLKTLLFLYQGLDSIEGRTELWHLYMEIVEQFAEEIQEPLEPILPEKRNGNLVLVITGQFLTVQHGPTKSALDRCKAIMIKMGKSVLLLNAAELLSNVGEIPFYNVRHATYMPEKSREKIQCWKGVEIPYYQCSNDMPDMDVLKSALREIREMAPGRVITIGGGGVLGGLVSQMLPVLTVGMVPSGLECTCAQYQTLGRKLMEEDILLLQHIGRTERHVIESVFTSSLKPQEEHITRKNLGIGENKFLMMVIGTRLDEEVTDEFLIMLDEVLEEDMYVGFLGYFSKYKDYINKFRRLREQSMYLGFCTDVLSRLEVSDLYVNPIRKGGGTSCVEAMFLGIPVVTVNYGDVAVNAGEAFCVNDYAEMQKKIRQYFNDKAYYGEMSEMARKRTEVLLDTEKEFVRIMQEMDKREQDCIERKAIQKCRS